jgi:hypothetical protein
MIETSSILEFVRNHLTLEGKMKQEGEKHWMMVGCGQVEVEMDCLVF